jgi:predicted phosphodiesterase
MARKFFDAGVFTTDDEAVKRIQELQDEVRKERMKLQTLNLERNRMDRNEARHELYYELIGNVVDTLPLPDFKPITNVKSEVSYLLCFGDFHYGSDFKCKNNEYSPAIFKERLKKLAGDVINFVQTKEISTLQIVSTGDDLQGILRLTDLQLNDTNVVKCLVDFCRLMAMFLNEISTYCKVEYYPVPQANHTQTRPIGTKANELAGEDLEYIIGNYISDLCRDNNRVVVTLADEDKDFIKIPVYDFNIIALHGHQVKNVNNAIKDLSILNREFIDYLIMGHYHGGKEFVNNDAATIDTETIIIPSFIGGDPYSESLFKSSKSSAQILGFDKKYGHVETYKFILS